MLKEQYQGWKFVDDDRFVCARCFDDYAIQEYISNNVESTKCWYCKRRSKTPIAAPMNSVLEVIGDGIRSEYGHPDNEGMPVEGGAYVFPTMWILEVLDEVGNPIVNEAVQDEIVDAFSDSLWVRRPLFGLSEDDRLRYGWRDFVKAVKYKTRYVFTIKKPKKSFIPSDAIPPAKMLDHIGQVLREVELVREMKAGAQWIRARQHNVTETFSSAADLGPAPRRKAWFSNRMSPAGIPMFYGAGDPDTAVAETYAPKAGEPAVVTLGLFMAAREMLVLDLTDLPAVPSLFDEGRRHLRSGISFLHDFVHDLTKPIARDGREHIDYVPTQVVSEYLRHVFKAEGGKRVRGILYRSSRKAGGICCALFFQSAHCCDVAPGWEQDNKKWLGFAGVTAVYKFGAPAEPADEA